MQKWYALYVRSRCEKKVHMELQQKKIGCFLPLIKQVHRWHDRKKTVEEPLFRGYVFVMTDLHDVLDILQTNHVAYIVGINGKPSPIPEE